MSARALTAVLIALVLDGCAQPQSASAVLEVDTNALPGLNAPEATLDVVDDAGKARAVTIEALGGQSVLVTTPVKVPCQQNGVCTLSLQVAPGTVTFTLHLTAADRCGTRAELLRLSSSPVVLKAFDAPVVKLEHIDASFDDDHDGIANVLEPAVCGRFDVGDRAAPPQACASASDLCCAGVSALEGHMTAFVGGDHLTASGAHVAVQPFALDATEVTWRQFSRCVAAGGCLPGQPSHPVRLALAAGVVDTEPVVGLNPAEAAALCAFMGKRLPSDDEWDFAAAHRADPAVRGRYPWDDDNADVGCRADFAGVAANFSIPGTSCAGAPTSVGSFASSLVQRGVGPGLADLAGNVAEWTLIAGNSAPTIPEVPAGTDAAVLRGGGALSALALLENDLPIVARFPSSGDIAAWQSTLDRLSSTAGFRCAASVDDATVEPPFAAEPACGAP